MNKELYEKLNIDINQPSKDLLNAIENIQGEYLERAETANTEERKQELELFISKIDDEIEELKKEIKSEKIAGKVDGIKKNNKEKQEREKQKAIEKSKQEHEKQEREKREKQISNNKANNPPPIKLHPMSNDSEEFKKIIEDYYDRFYVETFNALKPLAEGNDSSAQYVIGVMYLNGLGVNRDVARAKFWLQKASASESAAILSYAKCILQDQNSVEKEKKEAFDLLKNAAEAGDYEAMEDYVDACLNGIGNSKELKIAIKYCDLLKQNKTDSGFEVTKNSLKRLLGENHQSNVSSKKLRKIVIGIIIIAIVLVIGRLAIAYYRQTKFDSSEVISDVVTENESEIWLAINVSEANIRSGAGTDNEILATGHEGDIFTCTGNIEESSDGRIWYEVYLNDSDDTGWISEKVADIYE